MSRDYKPMPERPKTGSKGSPLLTGLLIGFLLGVAASLAVVMMIKGWQSPFAEQGPNAPSLADKIKEEEKKQATLDKQNATQTPNTESSNPPTEPNTDNTDEQKRFDFYSILPDGESKINPEDVNSKAHAPQPSVQYAYYLQVGAFQDEEDADNMKATLALQGFEALVQSAAIPDKGIWHRVRVGPLSNLDQINKTKNELASNGFKTDLIKVTVDE